MKFNSLTIENFMAITSAEFNLADRGLVLIQGQNLDDTSSKSNGAGKSSIFDAICWVLFGVTARDETGDAIVNDTAGKNTRVTIEINDNGHLYLISRHRKHKQHKNALLVSHLPPTLGALWGDLTKGTDKLTQEVVDKILGCSLDVFVGSIYAGQERMPDLPGMTDKQLKILIEEASGVTVLEEAYTLARTKFNEAKSAAVGVNAKFDSIIQAKDHDEGNLVNANRQHDEWETHRDDRVRHETTLARDYLKRVKELTAEIDAEDDRAAIVVEIAKADDRIQSVEHENTKLRKLQTDAVVSQANADSLARDLARLAKDFTARKASIEDIDHTVGCPCDTCGRDMSAEEIAPARAAAVKQANIVASEYKTTKTALEDAQKRTQTLTQERDAFEASMTDLTQETALRAQLQAKLNKIDRLTQERQGETIRARQHAERGKAIKVEPNPHVHSIERFKALLEKHDKDLEDLAEAKVKADTDVAQAEAVAKVFSPAGVRAFIMDDVTPELNRRTAHYLGILSDGNISANWTTLVANAKGELKEKFSIEVENAKGGKKFGLQSGGEKRKVRIACALALQDLVATRATKPIDLFLSDEIDDAIDEAGLERLMQVLNEKAKERGTIFVISHNSLRDWISQVVEIEKQNGETTVREVSA